MAIGDVSPVESGTVSDTYYVDTGMYDVASYGSVYIIDDDEPAIVDTGIGTNYERILDALESVGIAPEELAVIAPTHVHLDHAGGAGFLAEACPNATVYCHEIGAPHLVDPDRLVEGTKRAVGDRWQYYVEPKPVPQDRLVELQAGDRIDLGTHEVRTHHAPGHAPHHVVFEDPASDAVFTADAAGIYIQDGDRVSVTSPPPNFDFEACLADIETIRELDPETLCYAHYGPTSTGDTLDRYEATLTEWVENITATRADLDDDEAVIERFVDESDLYRYWDEFHVRSEVAMNARGVLTYLDRRD